MSQATAITIEGRRLVDDALREQGDLTAVDKFAERHERGELDDGSGVYRDLIPLTQPGEGEQYAFEVDLDACTGCKACVSACHNLNGLDEGETWRDVGRLVGGPLDEMIAQHVTAACHHCVEPACLEGCPVKAYEKDPVTGIVKHLDDQCIGCQYCTLKCPYDVPKYHKEKGIVRKCDMCSDRLAEGEAPACAQACPTGAIAIGIVDKSVARGRAADGDFVAGNPHPGYTVPTTRYKSERDLGGARPADNELLAPEDAHAPLAVMMVLTQLSVGGFLLQLLLEGTRAGAAAAASVQTAVSLATGLIALGASTLHLGRPLYAFRAVIGLRHSWLSREIVAFGLFAKTALLYAGLRFFAPDLLPPAAERAVGYGVVGLGLLGVLCSAMIYHDTRRWLWRIHKIGPRFLLTVLLLGGALTVALSVATAAWREPAPIAGFLRGAAVPLLCGIALVSAVKLAGEALVFGHLRRDELTALKRTALLMSGPLHQATLVRFMAGAGGGIALPGLLLLSPPDAGHPGSALVLVGGMLVLLVAGELIERLLFFAAVAAPRLPGDLAP